MESLYISILKEILVKSLRDIIKRLKTLKAPPATLAGMERFGINTSKAFGIPIPTLRKIAKEAGKNHDLAQELWATGFREAKILASMIDLPGCVTKSQMENWAKDFTTWDDCDQCCNNLFVYTKYANTVARKWTRREEEFVKRAGFVLIAVLAVHDKKATNRDFEKLLQLVIKGACDNRNFVKKAVNWALRQIGKRNRNLNNRAIDVAKKIQKIDSKAARWIASDALRELTDEKIQKKL